MPNTESKRSGNTNESSSAGRRGREPTRIRLPGFVDDEVGLGEVIRRVTSSAGIKPCGGCRRRAAALDRWLVFTPWRRA